MELDLKGQVTYWGFHLNCTVTQWPAMLKTYIVMEISIETSLKMDNFHREIYRVISGEDVLQFFIQ